MRDLSAYQQLSLTYGKPTNDSQSPSAGEDVGVDQARGVRLNKRHKAADPLQGSQIRDRRGATIAARKRALSVWDNANPGVACDPQLFLGDILPQLGTAPLSEIMEAAGCSRRPRPLPPPVVGRRTCRRGWQWPSWSRLSFLARSDGLASEVATRARRLVSLSPVRGAIPRLRRARHYRAPLLLSPTTADDRPWSTGSGCGARRPDT